MIDKIKTIRNIGPFDSSNGGSNLNFARLTLIYAENGRGKTMLSNILRSLATGDASLIEARYRLGASYTPHVVIESNSSNTPTIFQNGNWTNSLEDIAVFDDIFVDQNVYSGLDVEPAHRQNLLNLIIGSHGVKLSKRLEESVKKIKEHNDTLREKGNKIPQSIRGMLSVEDFCALRADPDIDNNILNAERGLKTFQDKDKVLNTPNIDVLNLPDIDTHSLNKLLKRDLPDLDSTAVKLVQNHFTSLRDGGEKWVAEGMNLMLSDETCPFCAQLLDSSSVFSHYRYYFSEEYNELKLDILAANDKFIQGHSGDEAANFERQIRVLNERLQFWSQFCDIPEISIDTESIVADWRNARNSVESALKEKQSAPLDSRPLSKDARNATAHFKKHFRKIKAVNRLLHNTIAVINGIKERQPGGDLQTLEDILNRLKATKARYSPEIAPLCDEYIRETKAKAKTEQERDAARDALNNYSANIFPRYEEKVNNYLKAFNAGFQLKSIRQHGLGTGSGSICNYQVLINNYPIPIAGGTSKPNQPSFRTTLSAGDRNSLAFAFFMATLDVEDPPLSNKIVVIDDPINSLDEHRSLTTVQEIRRLVSRYNQVLVLSHNKPFLCNVWENADKKKRVALALSRVNDASDLVSWDVNRDCIEEHDKRNESLIHYLNAPSPDKQRQVAESIRPHLEKFLRVSYPRYFPPGTLLGNFLNSCEQALKNSKPILNSADLNDLSDIKGYANKFHHDTNPAWESENINDIELCGFINRTLAFVRRPI